MSRIRLVAFDFDGVLVESNDIKTSGFAEVYRKYWGDDAAEVALAYHLANPGFSRFEKFAGIHQRALGRDITPEESQELGDAFTAYCLESIIRCPFVTGAREFIEKFSAHTPLAIVSATPQVELVEIVRARSMAPFFRYVLGKPSGKVKNLAWILEREGIAPTELLFVGDQPSDFQAATEVGCPFVLRSGQAPLEAFPGLGDAPRMEDLLDLDAAVASFS